MLRHVDLCSGIGGFSLGFQWAELSKPVLFCDIEPWSRQILAKHWFDVPIAEDVKELANDPDGLVPDCDILTAGYPCQSFSLAGRRKGTEDDRHIWPYIFSIIQSKRPTWCVFENVYGHVTLGLDEVLSDLERESYATRPFIVPACATDAPHRRDRLWIICRNVADTDSKLRGRGGVSKNTRRQEWECTEIKRESLQSENKYARSTYAKQSSQDVSQRTHDVGNTENERYKQWSDAEREGAENKQEQRLSVRGKPSGSGQHVADTASTRLQGAKWSEHKGNRNGLTTSSENVADTNSERRRSWNTQRKDAKAVRQSSRHSGNNSRRMEAWQPEPSVGRVANGIPRRVDRLRGLGNAIVPQIAMRIGQTIKATYDD